jgi:hypothetical protein
VRPRGKISPDDFGSPMPHLRRKLESHRLGWKIHGWLRASSANCPGCNVCQSLHLFQVRCTRPQDELVCTHFFLLLYGIFHCTARRGKASQTALGQLRVVAVVGIDVAVRLLQCIGTQSEFGASRQLRPTAPPVARELWRQLGPSQRDWRTVLDPPVSPTPALALRTQKQPYWAIRLRFATRHLLQVRADPASHTIPQSTLKITRETVAPDGFEREGILINGPATRGDL